MMEKLWYSRKDLAELKSIPVSAFYNKPWLLPPGGPSKQGGTDRWSRKQVWDSGWVWMSDSDLSLRGGRDGRGRAKAHGTADLCGLRWQGHGASAPVRAVVSGAGG